MDPRVVVVGGGYGGIVAAKALDEVAEVILIEPRDRFVHNVAALRGLVDPAWTDRLFLPYDRLLDRGRVRRDHAARVEANAVTLGSGERITTDYTVLAAGSAYPFPAKVDTPHSSSAKAKFGLTRDALARAGNVLLLGAGPVGLELAGEIKAAWPDKNITIVDPADDILAGEHHAALRTELRRQLGELDITLALGTSLSERPPSEPGEAKTFTAITRSGEQYSADIWFRCFGVEPVTDYLAADLAPARQPNGHIEVTAQLHLPGQQRVFAVGDVTAVPEAKTAQAAGEHAEVVAANIKTLMRGGERLSSYTPGPPGIALPLGPWGGASYTDETGLLDAATTSEIKGRDLMVDRFAEILGAG